MTSHSRAHFIAFDAGTGAGRCSIFDDRGNVITTCYQEWGYDTPAGLSSAAKSFSPEKFWGIISDLCRQAITESGVDPKSILAVSTTSQREGMIYLDKTGEEIYAGPNIDNRGENEYQDYSTQDDLVKQITGLRLFTIFGPARLLWFKKYQPKIYEQIDQVMMMSDWIAFRLSGKTSSTPTIASSSQLFDIRSGEWSKEVTSIFDIRDDIFPSLFDAGTVLGNISPQAAEDTGLHVQTLVVVGGGDTHLGLLGLGIQEENKFGTVAGTSTPLMATIDKPLISKVSTSSYSIPGIWTLESNAGMTGLPYRWVRDTFFDQARNDGHSTTFEEMNYLAAEIPPGSNDVVAYLGSGAAGFSHYDLGGFLFPLDWDLSHIKLGHFVRAAIETSVFGTVSNLLQLIDITNNQISSFPIGGGQTKNPLFNQALADVLDMPVITFKTKESTSLGAAICAAVGSGYYQTFNGAIDQMVQTEKTYSPNPLNVEIYKRAFQNWCDTHKRISK